MLLSIIIPVFNAEKYIERCIMSIISSNVQDIEIICVNDGSSDSSYQIINTLAKRIQILKIINNRSNEGVSFSRNVGIKNAKGRYIYFIDADDYVIPSEFKILCNQLLKNESDFIFCNYQILEDGILKNFQNTERLPSNKEGLILKILNWSAHLRIGSFVCDRDMIEKNNIFFCEETHYGEDIHFFIRMICFSQRIRYLDINVMCYHLNVFSAIQKISLRRFDETISRIKLLNFLENRGYSHACNYLLQESIPYSIINNTDLLASRGFNYYILKDFLNKNNFYLYLKGANFNPNLKKRIEILNFSFLIFYAKSHFKYKISMSKTLIYKFIFK